MFPENNGVGLHNNNSKYEFGRKTEIVLLAWSIAFLNYILLST